MSEPKKPFFFDKSRYQFLCVNDYKGTHSPEEENIKLVERVLEILQVENDGGERVIVLHASIDVCEEVDIFRFMLEEQPEDCDHGENFDCCGAHIYDFVRNNVHFVITGDWNAEFRLFVEADKLDVLNELVKGMNLGSEDVYKHYTDNL